MQLRNYQIAGIDEMRSRFQSGIKRLCYVGPCGSGKTVLMSHMATQAAKKSNRTLFLVHRRELLDQAVNTVSAHKLIQIASVHTIARRLDRTDEPQLIIIDEAHHVLAKTWLNVINRFPNACVVGLTATPARTGGKGLGDVFQELIFGPTAKDLIADGYLAPYKYYAPPVVADLENIKIKMGDYDHAEIAVRMDKPSITGDAISHYRKLAGGKRAIIYCASIQHSENTAQAFREAGYRAKHIDGDTPADTRKQATEDFRNGRLQILTNVDLISEGYDCPGCEAVILLRPTASLTLYIQQSMRGMRPGPGKTCIILDHVGNCQRHGLPDDDREWSLDGTIKRKKQEPATVSIRVCPMCYSAHKPDDKCPYCGFVYPVEAREIKQTEGELREITAVERKAKRMEVGMARTLDDLRRIAKERNYNPSWVYIQAKIKHIRR